MAYKVEGVIGRYTGILASEEKYRRPYTPPKRYLDQLGLSKMEKGQVSNIIESMFEEVKNGTKASKVGVKFIVNTRKSIYRSEVYSLLISQLLPTYGNDATSEINDDITSLENEGEITRNLALHPTKPIETKSEYKGRKPWYSSILNRFHRDR